MDTMPQSKTGLSQADISRQKVWLMFDRIAHRYDLLNRMLSLRQDVAWRKKLARLLPAGQKLRVLDVATGTADVLISLQKHASARIEGVGIDMSEKMLSVGRDKLARLELDDRLKLQTGDATEIALDEEAFDVVTIAFGIRNVTDVSRALQNMKRVLKIGGRLLVLEFSLPKNSLMKKLYLFYFRHILPIIGGSLSGDSYAYRYLNKTVESFPYGDAFCRLMEENGYRNVKQKPLTFGIATIYSGDKTTS